MALNGADLIGESHARARSTGWPMDTCHLDRQCQGTASNYRSEQSIAMQCLSLTSHRDPKTANCHQHSPVNCLNNINPSASQLSTGQHRRLITVGCHRPSVQLRPIGQLQTQKNRHTRPPRCTVTGGGPTKSASDIDAESVNPGRCSNGKTDIAGIRAANTAGTVQRLRILWQARSEEGPARGRPI